MKTKLSQAIAAIAVMGAATAASAAPAINHDGLGQALLFPLYTVENNNQTTLHLTNTTDEFKAVKVRFRRASDSADVLDFNLYLSPYDMWTGTLSQGEAGKTLLTSWDTSCISADPTRKLNEGQEFGVESDSTIGHIEVIEMAHWPADAGGVIDGAKHKGDTDTLGRRIPDNCQGIANAWDERKNGTWYQAYAAEVAAADNSSFENESLGLKPSGGLYGNAYVINVDQAWAASYEPTAMDIYDSEVAGNNHHRPKFGLPDLQGEDVDVLKLVLATPEWTDEAAGDLSGHVADLEGLVRLKNHGMFTAETIADSLRATNLYADYTLGNGIDANTELAVTFPMRYAGFPNPNADIEFDVMFRDREEAEFHPEATDWQWSPWVPGDNVEPNYFRNETNLIKLTHKDGVDRNDLGEWNHTIASTFTEGWVDLSFGVERLDVDLGELEADYQAYVTGSYFENDEEQEDRLEYAERRLGVALADGSSLNDLGNKVLAGDATDGYTYQTGKRILETSRVGQPAIGFSNIVLQNALAAPGVNNIYSITHQLKYKRPTP